MAAAVGQLPQLQKLVLCLQGNSVSPGPQICSKTAPQPSPYPSKAPGRLKPSSSQKPSSAAQRRRSAAAAQTPPKSPPSKPAQAGKWRGSSRRCPSRRTTSTSVKGGGAETSLRFFRVIWGKLGAGGLLGVSGSSFGRSSPFWEHRGWRSEVLGPLTPCQVRLLLRRVLHAGNPAPSAGAPGGFFGLRAFRRARARLGCCGEIGRMQGTESEGVWKVSEFRVELRVQASGPKSMQRSSFHLTSPAFSPWNRKEAAGLGCGSMSASGPLLARARLEGRRSRTLLKRGHALRRSCAVLGGGFCPRALRDMVFPRPVVTQGESSPPRKRSASYRSGHARVVLPGCGFKRRFHDETPFTEPMVKIRLRDILCSLHEDQHDQLHLPASFVPQHDKLQGFGL